MLKKSKHNYTRHVCYLKVHTNIHMLHDIYRIQSNLLFIYYFLLINTDATSKKLGHTHKLSFFNYYVENHCFLIGPNFFRYAHKMHNNTIEIILIDKLITYYYNNDSYYNHL